MYMINVAYVQEYSQTLFPFNTILIWNVGTCHAAAVKVEWARRSLLNRISMSHTFFPCRPVISCSSSHPFRTSQTISTSFCNLYTTSIQTMPSSAAPHVKSRCLEYPGSKIQRFLVPDDKVDWSQNWPQYNPVSYTDPSVVNKPVWADPDIGWATHMLFKVHQVR